MQISITLNGLVRTVPAGMNLIALLSHFDLPLERVAVELNRRIVPKPEWESTQVDEGAVLEVVTFVGGG